MTRVKWMHWEPSVSRDQMWQQSYLINVEISGLEKWDWEEQRSQTTFIQFRWVKWSEDWTNLGQTGGMIKNQLHIETCGGVQNVFLFLWPFIFLHCQQKWIMCEADEQSCLWLCKMEGGGEGEKVDEGCCEVGAVEKVSNYPTERKNWQSDDEQNSDRHTWRGESSCITCRRLAEAKLWHFYSLRTSHIRECFETYVSLGAARSAFQAFVSTI